ncbi:hypothetical protein [Tsukamurella tyrosinosolvens]|uniref:hypothetical protein n=1 Tax=Tsukamurella tyrosinosolvens TaxID=57704 RepID=UPI0034628170
MTPECHYAEAERLIETVDPIGGNLTAAQASALLIAAQVHATLAGAGLDRAENEKLKREVARLNRVIDEKIRDHNAEAERQERIGKALAAAHVIVHYDSCTDEFIVENKAADENKLLREVAGYPKEAVDD